MERTRELCNLHLRPLLQQGIVPVVTGFIGSTAEGVPTTLGRGGSDYSATILGAALDANEIVIWTDVDGLMTADPRLISDATLVHEVSYREASELAYFGAKVLHPKTLRAIARCGVPVWIRNTFATDRPGTRITPSGMGTGVKALAAVGDASLIRIGGPGLVGVTDALGRTFATIAAIRADALLISQSSSQNDICLVVGSSVTKHTVEALRREFAHDLAHETLEHITLDASVAIVAVVGHNVCAMSGSVGRTLTKLAEKDVNILAMTQGSSQCVLSFVVRQEDMKTALSVAHLQFELASPQSRSLRKTDTNPRPVAWFYGDERHSANAD